MKHGYGGVRIFIIAALTALLFVAGVVQAQEATELPVTYTANVVKPADTGSRPTRMSITIERWTTDAERQGLLQALQEGGTERLVEAMHGLDVGYVQMQKGLGQRVSVASLWQTDEGQLIRVATDRPFTAGPRLGGTRSLEYPIGVIEIRLPAEGAGEGTFYEATKVKFNEQGQIEIQSMQQDTGPRRLLGVQQEKKKQKKEKKSES
jgi:hypothetical protein